MRPPRRSSGPSWGAPAALAAVLVAGCAAAPEEAAPAGEAAVATTLATTVHLVPSGPAVARACEGELAQTYCAREDAERAAATCAARAACPGGACVTLHEAKGVPACRAGATYPTREACHAPVAEDCSFYRTCLEATRPCGEDGYALGFGERLCYAFLADDARFSAEGRAWLREVRPCLQRGLVPSLDDHAACDESYERAMSSHVACYTDEAHAICDLPLGDVVELARVLGRELFSLRALRQIRTIGLTCAGRAIARALGGADEVAARRGFFTGLADAAIDEASLDVWLSTRGARAQSP